MAPTWGRGERRAQPTAGQATTEYIAAIALVAAVLVLAAPAVGAPSIGKAVVAKMRLALCLVGSDICNARVARDAGLAPCPMRSDVTGHEATATAFSVELGHRLTLTVTPNSDGTVTIVRTAAGIAGLSGGVGPELSAGPVAFQGGGSAFRGPLLFFFFLLGNRKFKTSPPRST